MANLRDLIVVLPGITGSVLQRDGCDVWAASVRAAWGALRSRGESLDRLSLPRGADPGTDDLGDGVRASTLVQDATIVPGLVKIDGYSRLVEMIRQTFGTSLRDASAEGRKTPGNFVEFPYDWRRDNRYTAARLKRVVDEQLLQWRQHLGSNEPKAIFVAHSMGGLVARYYLEVLEGWPDCRALFTIGTPHRGSVNALESLVDGVRFPFVDMTAALRSFPSLYQLLPIYPVVERAGGTFRVAELADIPGVEQAAAADALQFHREIEAAVARHQAEARYLDPRSGYQLLPIVGFRQPTNQSASLGAGVTIARRVPTGVDAVLGDGDGTVPRASAIPLEQSHNVRQGFFPERHGTLQRNVNILQHVSASLEQLQVLGLGAIRGFNVSPAVAAQPGISLDLADAYDPGAPVTFNVSLVGASSVAGPPRARVERVAGGPVTISEFRRSQTGDWTLSLDSLMPGVYRVSVDVSDRQQAPPPPVHDLFEVVG
jgi:pimeloyl-ACP methyl ester carboxylesterase